MSLCNTCSDPPVAEVSLPTAEMVMKEIASFHATGYHFLQTHKGGVDGFLKEHPDFSYRGWFAGPDSTTRESFENLIASFYQTTLNVVKHFAKGEDQGMVPKLDNFSKIMFNKVDETTGPADHGFNTLIHNDLHMNNVLYT